MHRLNKKFRLIFLFAGTLAMIGVMAKTGASLKTPATPKGILNLEFAYNAAKASAVINAWTGTGTHDNIYAAKINTWLDFIFLFFYSFLLCTMAKTLASSFNGFFFVTGWSSAYAALIAGLLDVLENAGMLITLYGHVSNNYTLFTFIFSTAKWLLVLIAAVYILIAGSILLFRKIRTAG